MLTSLALSISGAAGAVGLYGTFIPGARVWGRVICRGPASSGIALTFDDGPTPGGTNRILDRLAELRVSATFFVIGRSAATHPDLVRRMDAEGHVVGNHSYDHAHFALFRGPWYWLDQIRRTDDCIERIIGKRPALFRPPMGFMTWPIHHAARSTGHAIVAWSCRGRDGIRGNTDDILRRLGKPKSGDIQLLHDGVDPHLKYPVDRSPTVAALGPLVSTLRAAGIDFGSLAQMLRIPAYSLGAALPSQFSPSPGTPGEGWGEGLNAKAERNPPHPNPLPAYRERGQE